MIRTRRHCDNPSADTGAVLSLIQKQPNYQAITAGMSVELNGLSYESYDEQTTCILKPYLIAATFIVTSPDGAQNALLVTVDIGLTRVIDFISESFFKASASCGNSWGCVPTPKLSGYGSYALNGQGQYYEQLEGVGIWTEPTVDFPGNHLPNQPGCVNNWPFTLTCELSIWSALTDHNTLIQAGANGVVCAGYCPNGNVFYQMWWEQWPATPNFCAIGDLKAGDGVESYVYSATFYGGGSNQWYFFVKDLANGKVCGNATSPTTINSFTPVVAQFLLERVRMETAASTLYHTSVLRYR